MRNQPARLLRTRRRRRRLNRLAAPPPRRGRLCNRVNRSAGGTAWKRADQHKRRAGAATGQANHDSPVMPGSRPHARRCTGDALDPPALRFALRHSPACALARWASPALILQGPGAGQRVQHLESWRLLGSGHRPRRQPGRTGQPPALRVLHAAGLAPGPSPINRRRA